jgi:transmembrane sensor
VPRGEQLTVSAARVVKSPHVEVADAMPWTRNKIVLRDTALIDVASEFNRYNSRPILITDPRINQIRTSGEFSSTDSAPLLRGLEALGLHQIRVSAPLIAR